jgi:hypothetical protein
MARRASDHQARDSACDAPNDMDLADPQQFERQDRSQELTYPKPDQPGEEIKTRLT